MSAGSIVPGCFRHSQRSPCAFPGRNPQPTLLGQRAFEPQDITIVAAPGDSLGIRRVKRFTSHSRLKCIYTHSHRCRWYPVVLMIDLCNDGIPPPHTSPLKKANQFSLVVSLSAPGSHVLTGLRQGFSFQNQQRMDWKGPVVDLVYSGSGCTSHCKRALYPQTNRLQLPLHEQNVGRLPWQTVCRKHLKHLALRPPHTCIYRYKSHTHIYIYTYILYIYCITQNASLGPMTPNEGDSMVAWACKRALHGTAMYLLAQLRSAHHSILKKNQVPLSQQDRKRCFAHCVLGFSFMQNVIGRKWNDGKYAMQGC